MGRLCGWGPLASHVSQPDSRQFHAGDREGLTQIAHFRGSLRRPHPRRRRGHSAWPGAIRSSRGQPVRAGTGFLSPTASKVPARTDMSPAPRSAAAHTEVPTMSGALAQATPLAASPATGTPAFPTIADRPSAQASGPTPQVRGRRSSRTGPSPMLAVCRRV